MGTAERMTRVKDQERVKARRRQARVVVRYWISIPDVREVAVRTSSVSLFPDVKIMNYIRDEKKSLPGKLGHEPSSTQRPLAIFTHNTALRTHLHIKPNHIFPTDGGIHPSPDGPSVILPRPYPKAAGQATESQCAHGQRDELESGQADAVEECGFSGGRGVGGEWVTGKGVE